VTNGEKAPAARILIVEDEPLIAQHLQLHLESQGYDVVAIAYSGKDAVKAVESNNPDLVLMDIVLPGNLDRIETASIVRRQHDVPVIYLTAFDEEQLVQRAKITEPYAYILKPFNERELKLTIEMALARHRLESQLRTGEQHFAEAQEIGLMGSWDWDIRINHLFWSDQIFHIFGLEPKVFGASYEAFLATIHPDDRRSVENAVNDALYRREPYAIEHRIVLPSGNVRIVHERGRVSFGDAGEPVRMQGTVQDVTERKALEDRIEELAFYDPLTKLPNRNLFLDRLDQLLAQAVRHDDSFALLFGDLDGFKAINDELGHEVGDQVLAIVGERIGNCIRATDTAARLGGDEFVVLVTDAEDRLNAVKVAGKIVSAVSQPLRIGEHEISVGISFGVAVFPRDGSDAKTLLRHADQEMYQVKESQARGV